MLDGKQRNQIEENINLAHDRANYWSRRTGWDIGECISIAYLGLCKAVKHFDRNKGTLATVAYRVMDNEFLLEIRKNKAIKRTANVVSLDETIFNDSGTILADIIGKEDTYNVEESAFQILSPFLNKVETDLMRDRFIRNRTQMQVAKQLGLSQRAISKRERTLKRKIKGLLEGVAFIG